MAGFYQIATKIESVYDIYLPAEVRGVLQNLRIVITLGLEGVPLSCTPLPPGYLSRLLFWFFAPIFLVALYTAGVALYAFRQRCMRRLPNAETRNIIERVTPVGLRVVFLLSAPAWRANPGTPWQESSNPLAYSGVFLTRVLCALHVAVILRLRTSRLRHACARTRLSAHFAPLLC